MYYTEDRYKFHKQDLCNNRVNCLTHANFINQQDSYTYVVQSSEVFSGWVFFFLLYLLFCIAENTSNPGSVLTFLPTFAQSLRSNFFRKEVVHFYCVNSQYLINSLLILPSLFNVTTLHMYAGSSALYNHLLFSKSH